MLELEERIVTELREIGDAVVPSERLDDMVQQRLARRERQHRLIRLSAVGATVLALIVGAVGLFSLNRRGDARPSSPGCATSRCSSCPATSQRATS